MSDQVYREIDDEGLYEGAESGTGDGEGFVFDFTAVKETKPLEEGWYDVTVKSAKAGKSGTGNPKIDIIWLIESDEEEAAGRTLPDQMVFTEKTAERNKRQLIALGLPEDFRGSLNEIAESILGAEAQIQVKIESGRTNAETGEEYAPRNRVTRIKSAQNFSI
jgi:hypothetical protein